MSNGISMFTEGDDAVTLTNIICDLKAKAGDDRIVVKDNKYTFFIFGEAGRDTMIGGEGRDRFFGGDDGDHLIGGKGNDLLSGDEGDDLIEGGAGLDALFGGDSSTRTSPRIGGESYEYDYIDGSDIRKLTGGDTLFGGAGNDEIIGFDGTDHLYGGDQNDDVYGGADDDLLDGGGGHDELYGGSGNDTIYGGAGSDTLIGGDGDDTIITGLNKAEVARGGAGEDVFMFNGQRGDPSTNNFTPRTNIQDFEIGVDRLDITGEITGFFVAQNGASSRLVLENGTNVVLEGIDFQTTVLDDLF